MCNSHKYPHIMAEKERIEKVMQLEGMNSAVFAAAINIQGSTLSHILNGRNNPSLSVLQSILNRFPSISPEWLIMGQGQMERSSKQSQTPTLFDSVDENSSKSIVLESKIASKNDTNFSTIQQKTDVINEIPTQTQQEQEKSVSLPPIESNAKVVRKIIVYYTDNTFQEFQ
jgi:transcriptional regulator with XRE-family HTH domain